MRFLKLRLSVTWSLNSTLFVNQLSPTSLPRDLTYILPVAIETFLPPVCGFLLFGVFGVILPVMKPWCLNSVVNMKLTLVIYHNIV